MNAIKILSQNAAIPKAFDAMATLDKADWNDESFQRIFNDAVQKVVQDTQGDVPEKMRSEVVRVAQDTIKRHAPQLVEAYAGLGMSRQSFVDEVSSRVKAVVERLIERQQKEQELERTQQERIRLREQEKRKEQEIEQKERDKQELKRQKTEKQVSEKKELIRVLEKALRRGGNPTDAIMDAYNEGEMTLEQMKKIMQRLQARRTSRAAFVTNNWFKLAMTHGGRL